MVHIQKSLCLKGAVSEHVAAGERNFPFCQEGLDACESRQALHAVCGHALGIEFQVVGLRDFIELVRRFRRQGPIQLAGLALLVVPLQERETIVPRVVSMLVLPNPPFAGALIGFGSLEAVGHHNDLFRPLHGEDALP